MLRPLPIPEEEQFQALASGLKGVYRLLRGFIGDLDKAPKVRGHITVTKSQLAEYLRQHPELAERHVAHPSDPRYHECPVLERTARGFQVYDIDHGEARWREDFDSLPDAAAEYLMRDLMRAPP